MTLTTSTNKSLKQTIRDIRFKEKRLSKLYEDLSYYRHLLYTPSSPNYEREGTPSNVPVNMTIIYIDKIFILEKKIKVIEDEIDDVNSFLKTLTPKPHKAVIEIYYDYKTKSEFARENKTSREAVIQMLERVEKKWDENTILKT